MLYDHEITPRDLKNIHEEYQSHNIRPKVTDVLSLLQCQCKKLAELFIVVDALYECSEDVRSTLIDKLRSLQPRINLLVTSRVIASIGEQFQEDYLLRITALDRDIEAYINYRISQAPRLLKYVGRDPGLEAHIGQMVVQKVQNMLA